MAIDFRGGTNDIDTSIELSNVKLQSIYNELLQKLEAGEEVALTAGTLAALESVNATITNLPTDYPDSAAIRMYQYKSPEHSQVKQPFSARTTTRTGTSLN